MRAWNMGDSKLSYSAPLNTSAFLFFYYFFSVSRWAVPVTCGCLPTGGWRSLGATRGRGGSGPGSGPFGVSRLLG